MITQLVFGNRYAEEPEKSWENRRILMIATLVIGVGMLILSVIGVLVLGIMEWSRLLNIQLICTSFGIYIYTRHALRRFKRTLTPLFLFSVMLYVGWFCNHRERTQLFPVMMMSACLIMISADPATIPMVFLMFLQLGWTTYFAVINNIPGTSSIDLRDYGYSYSPKVQAVVSVLFGVASLAPVFILFRYLHRLRTQEQGQESVVNAAHAISQAIVDYDIPKAAAVLEDHAEFLDPVMRQAFTDIVDHLQEYRAFLPPALLSHHRALNQVLMRSQSLSFAPADGEKITLGTSANRSPSALTPRRLTSLSNDFNEEDPLFKVSVGSDGISELFVSDVQSTRSETPSNLWALSHGGRGGGSRNAATPQHGLTVAALNSFQSPFHQFPKAVVGFVEFTRFTLMSQSEAGPALSAGFATLARLCREYDATLQGCTGDTALLTWGVDRDRPSDVAEVVCRFAIALRSAFAHSADRTPSIALAGAPCDVSCAISSGSALCGAVGHDTAKHFSVLGPCSPGQAPGAALLLQLEGAKFHNAITVSPELAELAHGLFHVRVIDIVGSCTCTTRRSILSKHSACVGSTESDKATSIRLCEVVAPVATLSDAAEGGNTAATEWMYNLQHQAASSSPFGVCAVMNSAVEKLAMGHYDEAAAVLDTLSNQQRLDPRVATLERSAAAWYSGKKLTKGRNSSSMKNGDSGGAEEVPLTDATCYCRQFYD